MSDSSSVFLAVDLGAESGRVVAGSFDGTSIALDEVHRFANGPVNVQGSLFWDFLGLWKNIKAGLAKAAHIYGDGVVGIGLDTWGVDYGLLAADDTLLGTPYHYRDSRTDHAMEDAFAIVPKAEIYERTGIQFMQFNSVFQLMAMVKAGSPVLDVAETFLNLPDLLNFWLTGRKVSEFSIATTSQCYDPRAGDWAYDMLEKLGIPKRMFGEIVPSGTVLGPLLASVAEETGLGRVPVIAPATHDTGSAVAAVPMDPDNAIYLSSGTWSLMGIESKVPVIDERMLAHNLTNEGGVDDTFRLLKNIMGLWLIQECKRQWARDGQDLSYGELTELASAAQPFFGHVDCDCSDFLAPGDMPTRINKHLSDTGQTPTDDKGQMVRLVLESLAMKYRRTLEAIEDTTSRTVDVLNVVGGGIQNELLCLFAANAIGRKVVAGPIEATASGNILMQAIATEQIENIAQAREIVRNSFDLREYQPQDSMIWAQKYEQYAR